MHSEDTWGKESMTHAPTHIIPDGEITQTLATQSHNNFQSYQQRNPPQAAPKKPVIPLKDIVKSLTNTI